MKKLIFSLATCATITIPTVLAISCGSQQLSSQITPISNPNTGSVLAEKNSKIDDCHALDAILAKAKYHIKNGVDKSELLNAVKSATVIASYAGQMHDLSHSANDYVLLLKKGDLVDQQVSTALDHATSDMYAWNDTTPSGAEDPQATDKTVSSLQQRWGMTKKQFSDATLIVFFQKGSSTIVSYSELAKINGEVYYNENNTHYFDADIADESQLGMTEPANCPV